MATSNNDALIDAITALTKELKSQEKRASKKSRKKKEKAEAKKLQKERDKRREAIKDKALGAARSGTNAGIGFAAAATDPRDVTGVGSSAALNSALDSIVGQAGGGFIRNVTGLTNIQNIQNKVEGGVQALIDSNAQAGLRTPKQQIIQAGRQYTEIATIQNEEREKAKKILEEAGLSSAFSIENQAEIVMKKFVSNLELMNKALERYLRLGRT